jgi:cytochrome c peroxidase
MSPEDQIVIDRIFANIGKAIAAYERRLVSRHSRFDVFVEGLRDRDAEKVRALSPRERIGLKIFIGRGQCRLCHSGPNFTDGEFHNLGIQSTSRASAPSRQSALKELERDPFNSKGNFSDDRRAGEKKLDHLSQGRDLWGQVKTPSLRNVAKTSPYMHQGQFTTLADVVRFYSDLRGMTQAGTAEHAILVPLKLRNNEIEALVTFLECLTDESLEERLTRPISDGMSATR